MQGEQETQPYERGEESYLAFAIASAGVRAIAEGTARDVEAPLEAGHG